MTGTRTEDCYITLMGDTVPDGDHSCLLRTHHGLEYRLECEESHYPLYTNTNAAALVTGRFESRVDGTRVVKPDSWIIL